MPCQQMVVVSFAFNVHDSSVTIAIDNKILLVSEAERYFRSKRKVCASVQEMEELILYALSLLNLTPNHVTHWCGTAFENQFLPLENRLCQWTKRFKISLFGKTVYFYAVNHHLSHASLYYASGFNQALIKSCDGGGDGQKHVVYLGKGKNITVLPEKEIIKRFNGTFYDVVSSYIYKIDGQDGKFMGLSGYGELNEKFYQCFSENCDFLCNDSYGDPYGQPTNGWHLLDKLGLKNFEVSDPKAQSFAKTAQVFFEEQQVESVRHYEEISENLVLVGGTALNILANSEIRKRTQFKNIFVPPCCDDTGQSLGALLYFMNNDLNINPQVNLPFLGAGTRNEEIEVDENCIEQVVSDLKAGKVVAWHLCQGEVGPRALGHRSLLTSPLSLENKVLVSEKIKRRERYRPVAPIVLSEYQTDYFDFEGDSPYMSFSAQASVLATEKAPAIVHVDGSARLQTVNKTNDPYLYAILTAWREETGIPILINTSLNEKGEPICASYEDTLNFAKNKPSLTVYLEAKKFDKGE